MGMDIGRALAMHLQGHLFEALQWPLWKAVINFHAFGRISNPLKWSATACQ